MTLSYFGLITLMVLSPVPPELFMPLAGFMVAQGKLDFVSVVAAGLLGFLVSVVPWYFAGRLLGEERLKQLADKPWMPASSRGIYKTIYQGNRWFRRHGGKAVLLGLFLPGTRNILALPAGLSQMSIPAYLSYTTFGAVTWLTGLTSLGYFLGDRYHLVEQNMDTVATSIWLMLAVATSIWAVRHLLQRHKRRMAGK
jgi:membrane protein DedA with SNARE-associated domain